jgi:hypothetical protein
MNNIREVRMSSQTDSLSNEKLGRRYTQLATWDSAYGVNSLKSLSDSCLVVFKNSFIS